MLLLIDIGNTRIKWALQGDAAALGAWAASGTLLHAELTQLPAQLQLALAGRSVTRTLASNVAGRALGQALQQILQQLPGQDWTATAIDWFASLPQLAGIKNGYRNPAQLGCDRFATAIGARAFAPGRALIVATCGTATTIDAITPDGVFIGGMILPGLGLMASSLAHNTAQLPHIASSIVTLGGFADNTDDAIVQGCLAAQTGAIERACNAHAAMYNTSQGDDGSMLCLLSGGAARFVAPNLPRPHQVVDNLVLIGLQVVANNREHQC
jgi:type III pantothenate kinase